MVCLVADVWEDIWTSDSEVGYWVCVCACIYSWDEDELLIHQEWATAQDWQVYTKPLLWCLTMRYIKTRVKCTISNEKNKQKIFRGGAQLPTQTPLPLGSVHPSQTSPPRGLWPQDARAYGHFFFYSLRPENNLNYPRTALIISVAKMLRNFTTERKANKSHIFSRVSN